MGLEVGPPDFQLWAQPPALPASSPWIGSADCLGMSCLSGSGISVPVARLGWAWLGAGWPLGRDWWAQSAWSFAQTAHGLQKPWLPFPDPCLPAWACSSELVVLSVLRVNKPVWMTSCSPALFATHHHQHLVPLENYNYLTGARTGPESSSFFSPLTSEFLPLKWVGACWWCCFFWGYGFFFPGP